MPKWCEWSFLLELQMELLYLEQSSAAVAYSHFSARWWHFHNVFFRWISSSSWTFWQKGCDFWGVNWRPNWVFLGCLVPTGTNRKANGGSTNQKTRKGLHWRSLKSVDLSKQLPRQFHRLGDHGWGCFSNGPQLTRCVCRFANWILICKKTANTGDDRWWLLTIAGDDWCNEIFGWQWMMRQMEQSQFGGCGLATCPQCAAFATGDSPISFRVGIASWMVGNGWLMDMDSNDFCQWSLMNEVPK